MSNGEPKRKLVMGFMSMDLKAYGEDQLKDRTLSFVSPKALRVRVKALRVEMLSLADSLRKESEK